MSLPTVSNALPSAGATTPQHSTTVTTNTATEVICSGIFILRSTIQKSETSSSDDDCRETWGWKTASGCSELQCGARGYILKVLSRLRFASGWL
uniref:Uncharacterized protein n=1 Tax=Physcomitrium patens TaxID=3218 RepID=A0A2K1IVZ0_PHYPA|nr:hypothetical protein PHYPA_025389 [Physcomitrium patens]